MAATIARFLVVMVTTYLGLLAVTFFIGRVVPIDPVLAVLGDRAACVARELTKKFEEARRGTLSQLAGDYAAQEPRGEIVLVVAPPQAGAASARADDLDARLRAAMASLSLKDAAALVSGETGRPRREVYARALTLARDEQAP